MAYDEGLAQRIREVLASRGPTIQNSVAEKKMFGGLAFMLQGNMCCGVSGDDLMARVGADSYAEALALPYARPMDFTGKPLKGFIYVGPDGLEADEDLDAWVDRCVQFSLSLPAK